ncbi:MAG: FecCD family ABC transporter permease [Syntrophobacteraceae bacterium]
MQTTIPYELSIIKRILYVSLLLTACLLIVAFLAVSTGSAGQNMRLVLNLLSGHADPNSPMANIILRIRLPRVALAALAGAALSLGGLVFQCLLRNPLAEPYILGVSGGAAVGAITAILLGLSSFPGVAFLAFAGSMATLAVVIVIVSLRPAMKKDALILAGVMVNAFCSSVIMFLISLTQDSRIHNILFWLMGDLSITDGGKIPVLSATLLPCFACLFLLARPMNLLMMGEEMARNMGVNIRLVTLALLLVTSCMVSAVVCHAGLLGFVGLVIPHLLRLLFGPDHRVLVPASILGGSAYLVFCDLLARSFSAQGEMPVGVITAMIGAPLFVFLLQRSRR